MKKLLLVAALVATAAWGGERYLGTMQVGDAGTVTNRCTGWVAYSSATAFVVPPLAKLSVQCDAAAYVLTDVAGLDAGVSAIGVKLAADQFFTTSINSTKTLTCRAFASDGGAAGHLVTYTGSHIAMSPAGAAAANCKVFERNGYE